jgi:hypothetical protein
VGWLQLQADFLTMSTHAEQVWAQHADHHINHTDPDFMATVFLDTIRDTSCAQHRPR